MISLKFSKFLLLTLLIHQFLFIAESKKSEDSDYSDDFPDLDIQKDYSNYVPDNYMQRLSHNIKRRPEFPINDYKDELDDEDAKDTEKNDEEVKDEDQVKLFRRSQGIARPQIQRKTFSDEVDTPASGSTLYPGKIVITAKSLKLADDDNEGSAKVSKTRRFSSGFYNGRNNGNRKSPDPCLVYDDCNVNIG